jgi:hypothetical protein
MTQENLGLILDLYKEDKIDRDSAISLIEDLANNKTQWYWTTPNPIISTYKDTVPASVPYTTFSTNQAELNFKQYGDNQMPKMQM